MTVQIYVQTSHAKIQLLLACVVTVHALHVLGQWQQWGAGGTGSWSCGPHVGYRLLHRSTVFTAPLTALVPAPATSSSTSSSWACRCCTVVVAGAGLQSPPAPGEGLKPRACEDGS
ncbi:hypothetical protein V8C86DRAFT_2961463 [Haematococcus lacustris]